MEKRQPKYWSDADLKNLLFSIIGERELSLEQLREKMSLEARLPIISFDEVIKTACVIEEGRYKLNEKSLQSYKKLSENK